MAGRISRKTWIIAAIVIIVAGVIAGIALSGNSSSPSKAPDFTLPVLTGDNITLSKLEGIPVVLNFWSISCLYCVKQLPYLEDVARQSEAVPEVIGINMRDSVSEIRSFFVDYKPAMIIALDSNGEAFRDYCLAYNNTRGYIPFTLFIDSGGMVQYVKIGAFASEEALWNTLHEVFGIAIP